MDIKRPTLVVGVGGTGCWVADRVYEDGLRLGLVHSRMLTVIGLDTSERDQEQLELKETQKVRFSTGARVHDLLRRNPEAENSWFYPRGTLSADLLNMSLLDGAGQVRMLTRLALSDAFRNGSLENSLRAPLSELTTIANQAAFKGQINVVVVGSLAGGTGCGSFLQVALALREIAEVGKLAKLVVRGLFLLPDVYVRGAGFSRDQARNVVANATAALRELNAITQAAVGHQPIDSIDFEFMPGRQIKHGQMPFEVVTLIDYEMRNGQTLGPSLDSYKELLYRAAYTQLFLPLGQEIDDRSVNSVQQKLAGVALNTSNSYASVGIFSITYPEPEILAHLTDRFAAGVLEGDWLVLDRSYRRRVESYEERRRAGDLTAVFPERGASFIADLEQLARDRRPLVIDIYDNVHKEEVQDDGSVLQRISYMRFLDAFEGYITGEFQRANDRIREAYSTNFITATQLGERSDLDSAIRRRENTLDRDWKCMLDAARQEPDTIYENVWASGLTLSPAEWQPHHVQRYLVATSPHLIEVRYLLYLMLREIDKRLNGINPSDHQRDVVEAAAPFEANKKPVEGRRAGQGVLVEAAAVTQERALSRMMSGSFQKFVNRYVAYHNTSLLNMRLYAEAALRKRALERMRNDLAEIVRLLELLFADLEAFQSELAQGIEAGRTRHVGAAGADRGHVYVFADAQAKDQLWDQIKPEALGTDIGKAANSRLVSALFDVMKRRRVSRHTGGKEMEFAARDLFKKEVVEGFCKRRLVEDLKGVYSFNVVDAIRREADLRGQRFEVRIEELVRIVGQQAQPFIQLVDGTRPPEIVYWAMHPETRAALGNSGLFNSLFRYREEVSGIDGEEYDRNALVCVDVLYNFPMLALAKLTPGNRSSRSVYDDPVGRYDGLYRQWIEDLIKSESSNSRGVRSMLSPHLHRDWHTATGLPEIFPQEQEKQQLAVYRDFVIAIGLGYLKRETEIGDAVAVFYDPTKLHIGGNRQVLTVGHAIDRMLVEFKRRAEISRAARAGFDTMLEEVRSGRGGSGQGNWASELFERFAKPELLADFLSISRNQLNRDAEQDMIQTVRAYFALLRETIDLARPELVEGRRQQLYATLIQDLGNQAIALAESSQNIMGDALDRVRRTLGNIVQSEAR